MKRMLAILSAAALLCTLCMAGVLTSAAEGEYAYAVNGTQATITAYNGVGQQLTVPETIDGYTVTAIGDNAFAGSAVTQVTLPDTVTSIGECAFENAVSLAQITIGSGMKTIRIFAFRGCSALQTVCYTGSELGWNAITIHAGNTELTEAELLCAADLAQTTSLLPASKSAFDIVQGEQTQGGTLTISQATDGSYTFRSNAGWPFAYVDYGTDGGITVDTAGEQYLNYDFTVHSGETNIVVAFGGESALNPTYGAYVCLNGLIDPNNILPDGTIIDLRPGHYTGSVKVSQLGCRADLMTDGCFTITGFKVFAVTDSTYGAGSVTVHSLSVGESVAAAEMPAPARDGSKLSLLPDRVNDWICESVNGWDVYVSREAAGDRFVSYDAWPYAYTLRDAGEYIPVDVTEDHYLYYDFTVTSGQTNIVVCFGGTHPTADDPYGTWVSLNALVDPDNEQNGTITDIGPGTYRGCVRIGDLPIRSSMLTGNTVTVSDVKVFAVSSIDFADVLVKDISIIKATAKEPAVTVSTTTTTTTTTRPMEGEVITYTVGDIRGSVGDIVEVPVSVSDGHFMVNGQLVLRYDPQALALQAVTDDPESPYVAEVNGAILEAGKTLWSFNTSDEGEARLVFASSAAMGKATGGTMFTLSFRILSASAHGTSLSLEIPEMRSNNAADAADYHTNVAVQNGFVIVEDAILRGDVDLNGDVEMLDAVKLFQYINGKLELEPQALLNAELAPPDQEVSLLDAARLFQFINGQLEEL